MGTYLWRCVWAFLLLLVAVLVGAPLGPSVASAAEAICSNPAVWFCGDFEDGSTHGLLQSGGWFNSTAKAAFGTRSLQVDYGSLPRAGDNGGSGFGEWRRSTSLPVTNVFHVRWYEYLSAGWQWSPIATKGFVIFPRAGQSAWKLYVLNDPSTGSGFNGHRCLYVEQTDSYYCPNTGPANLRLFPIDRWVSVEIHLDMVAGVYREWRDGVLVSNYSGLTYGNVAGGGGLWIFEVAAYWNCTASNCLNNTRGPQSRWLDNIVAIDGDIMIGAAGTVPVAPPTYTLTVSKAGTGTGTVSGPGVSCGIDCAELVPGGTSVTLTAAPGPGATFTGWSGGACSGTGLCTTTVSANTTVTATFALPTYTLTVSKAGTGTGTVSGPGVSCGIDCAELVPGGTSVTLTAAPSPGATFTGWSGGACSGTGLCTTTVSANTTVTATFALPTYTLTVSKAGTGTGTVSGPGVSCGIDCAELVPGGTSVTLTAAPSPGATFTGWSGGACSGTGLCTTTVSANTTVTATFALPTYTLTVSKAGTGTGTVSGPGVSCGIDCAELVPGGTSVTLTAAPSPGATFTGWSGGACSGTGLCTTTVSANTTVTATFALPTYTLTVSKAGTGTGTVSGPGVSCGIDCAELVPGGTSVTLTAAPGPGATFTGWSGGACSGTGLCTTTVSANTTVTATFALPTYTLTVSKAGTGTGTVSGPGVSCGIDCAELVPGGTSVTLTAAPGPGATFTGWSGGACSGTGLCTTTVSANTTVTATFALPTYTLTVSTTGSGTGTVSGLGINCGTDCSEPVASGGVVSLAVAPASGSVFAGWSGACGGTGDCTVTVSANTVVGATFDSTPSSSLVEIIVGAEPGSAPRVRGLTRDGVPTTTDFLAYASSFTGGLFVGLGRLGSPSSPLIVTGSGAGIPAEVRAFRHDGSSAGASVRPYGKSFSGGVRIAVCDVDGDGTDEIVTVPGSEYKPQVAIWALGSQSTSKVLTFNAGRPTFTTGLFVACADFDGDGASEIVVGNDQGAAPEVRVYRVTGTSRVELVASFLAYDSSFTGGVRVATADVDGDGLADIITAPGVGGEPVVRAFKITGGTVTDLTAFHAEDPGFTGGLFVAGGKRDELGGAVVMTSPGPGGSPHVRIFSVSPVVVIESATVVVGDPGVLRGVTLGASQ